MVATVTRTKKPQLVAIRILRQLVTEAEAEGQTTISVAELRAAIDRIERP